MSDERPDALLKSALEKIVYFEARAEQLNHELTSTREEMAHLRRELSQSEERELTLRREVAGLEVRLDRMAAEREELTRLNQALRTERSQLLGKLLEASRIRTSDGREREDDDDDGLGIDLASFISQLRSEALERPAASAPAAPAFPWPSPSEPQRSQEVEPGLGNGGLGRLAACFLDSAATQDFPLTGYGLLYRYGLFRQEFEDGFQREHPDAWKESFYPFIIRRGSGQRIVKFDDMHVRAIPYDMPITGYGTDNVGTLRLWDASPIAEFDYDGKLIPSLPMIDPLQESYMAWLMKYRLLKPAYVAVLKGRV